MMITCVLFSQTICQKSSKVDGMGPEKGEGRKENVFPFRVFKTGSQWALTGYELKKILDSSDLYE